MEERGVRRQVVASPQPARRRRGRVVLPGAAGEEAAVYEEGLAGDVRGGVGGQKEQGADDIVVFVGGVVPQQDYDFLYQAGVKGIYGPGTPIPASAKDVLEQIRKAQGR
jgi:hypothetical protein